MAGQLLLFENAAENNKNKEYQREWYKKNSARKLEYQREYRARNKKKVDEKRRVYAREYRRENRDKILDRENKYREENPEKKVIWQKAYYNKNSDKLKEKRRQYYRKNKEKIVEWRQKYLYGVTPNQLFRMIDEQGNKCAICGKQFEDGSRKGPYIDHDHETKAVRSLLCKMCNLGIGYFNEDTEILQRVIDYLNKHRLRVSE